MWPLFKFINLFYLLVSSYIWFGFLIPRNNLPLIISGMLIICYALGQFKTRLTPKVYALLGILLLYSLYSLYILDVKFGLNIFMSYLPAILLFMLDKPLQRNLLTFVTKWVSIIMGVSIFFYGLHFILPLPSFTFLPADISASYSTFDNYIFFMKAKMYLNDEIGIVRFGGPFLEPGHQALICCLLLFANRFRMKEQPYMWCLIASIALSFSLAGYIIFVLGLAFAKIRNIITMIAISSVVAGAWFFVGFIWNDGDNAVNVLVLQRLEYDTEKGIKGNNRTIKHTDYFFKECMKDGTAILGVQKRKVDSLKINGAGYKIFILRYGIVGTIFVAILYLLFIPAGVNRRYAICFYLLMVAIFLQRAYPTWYSWLLPYVLGLGVMRGVGRDEFIDHNDESFFDEDEENIASELDGADSEAMIQSKGLPG